MLKNLEAVREFSKKFKLPDRSQPGFPAGDVVRLRLSRLYEECLEIANACDNDDLAGVLDGLVDLEYILHGTTLAFGLQDVYQEAFRRVHVANMKKKRAARASDSKHNSQFDIVKPDGWVSPNFDDLLPSEE